MKKNSASRENLAIYASVTLLFISAYLFTIKQIDMNSNLNDFTIKSIDTKNISTAKISYKNSLKTPEDTAKIQDTVLENIPSNEKKPENNIQQINKPVNSPWQLPTKSGSITTYPNYNHVAFDITSAKGVNETIYPIADGTVSGIYYDSAGAKIVTVHHHINGINYTSQYVHLSSYASGLYVGKPVTRNDPLGQMGRTGNATGVHLHITVTDCILFNPDDNNCKDLNGFYRYIKLRYKQGFAGLNNLINVPHSW